MVRRLAQRRLLIPIAALALSLLSCGREVTGPENGIFRNRIAMLAFEPVFTGPIAAVDGAGDAVPFEKVRVVLRALDGTIVKDTMVDFPSDVDEVSLSLTIPIPQDSPAEGLPLTVAMAYVNAAGDTVFRGGPNPLVARPVGSAGAGTPVTVPVEYDGTGKDAARVAITPKTGTAVAGQTLAFSATAFDDADQPIANTPFVFSTLDPTRATVDPVTGLATWLPARGTARVIAELPNGDRADTATFTVALPAAKLVLGSGGGQIGAVNAPLADTIVVRTLASDDVPVEGVIVTFAVATGAGTLSVLEDTSDANGDVKTVWTLGAPLGAQTITATSAGLTGSPLTIDASAVAGAPTLLEITAQPTTGTAGSALAPSFTVTARDAFGNVATAFNGDVTIGVGGENPPALGGTVTRAAVGGVATFNDLSLELAGGYQFVASSGTLQPDTTSAITIAAAAAARLEFVQEPLDAAAGADLTPAVTVRAVDAFGNTVPSYAGSVNLTLDAPAGVALLGTLPRTAVAGIATFSDLAVREAGIGYRLIASATSLTADTSANFGITALSPTVIAELGGDGQSAAAGTVLNDSIVARVTDEFANPIAGASVSVSVVSGGGSVSSSTLTADATGRVALRWTLGALVGTQQISLAVLGVPTSTVTVSATATIGAPAQLVFTQEPAASVAGAALMPAPRVEVRDAIGNLVVTYTGEVTIALDSNPTATALNGTLTVNAIAGIATWPDLSLTAAGSGYTFVATLVTEGVPSAATAPFDVVAAAAAQFFVFSGNNQSVVAGGAFADSLKVRVLDQYGNPKIGHPTTWSENGVVTLGAVGEVLTDSIGVATNTATAGTTAGAQSAGPSVSTQEQGSVLVFEHTVVAAAAASIAQATVSNDGQTVVAGDTLAPFRVRVSDFAGNPVSGVSVTWTPTAGGAFVEAVTVTDANGEAEGILVAPQDPGTATAIAEVSGLSGSPVGFSATIEVGPASQLAILIAPTPTVTAGVALTDFVVRAENRFGYPAAFADTMRVSVVDGPVGGGIVAGDTAVLADSAATFSGLTFHVAGSYTLEFRAAGLDSVRYVPITVAASDPNTVFISGGDGQVGVAGTAIANPLEITVQDAFGNPVPNFETYWFVSSGSGALLDAPTFFTDSLGVARATLQFGAEVESFTVTGSALDAGQVEFSLSATNAPAANLIVSAEPGTTVAGTAIGPVVLIARDALLNPALDFTGDVTALVDSGPAGATLGGTTTVAATAGTATFSDLTLDRVGTYRLRFQSAGLSDAVSLDFVVTVAAAARISIVEGDAQTDTVAATLATPLRVRVTDSFGNPVSGTSLTWTSNPAVTYVSESPIGTDINGEMAQTVALGTVTGAYTVTTAIAELPDSSVTFNLTAQSGAMVSVVVTSAPDTAMAGDSVAIDVETRDQFGNVATSFTGDVTIVRSDAVADPLGTVTVPAVEGVASFTEIYFGLRGAYYLQALADTVRSAGFEVRVIPGPSAVLSIASGDNQTGFTGFPLDASILLRVADAFDNPIVGDTVIVTRDIGSGILGDLQDSLVIETDSQGQAFVVWTLGPELGTQTLSARTATLGPVTITATAEQAVANAIWTGTLNSSAIDGANWRNGVVPAPTDSVLIPAGVPNYPALATTTTYARLTVEDGAALNLGPYTLNVTRDIRAPLVGGIFTTNAGSVTADSAGTIVGYVPQLTVNGDYQTAGVVVVDGSVSVQNNATFTINGNDSLHVGTTLFTNGGATTGGALNQVGGSGIYVGSGGLFLDGGTSTFGAGGRLHLLGSLFTQQTAAPTAFIADSAHELYLLPGATQDIYLFLNDVTPDGACTASCLGTVISNKAAGQGGIRFLTDVMARGGFQVNVDSIGGNPTYVVAGAPSTLRAPIGGQFRRFGFTGSFDVNAFSADTLVAFGSGYLPANLAIPTIVAGQYLISDVHNNALFVDGVLGVEGNAAVVNGEFRTRGNGWLTMTEPTDSLVLTGDAYFDGFSESGQLTAGVLDVQGSIFSVGTAGALLADSGHVLRFAGGGGHSLTLTDGTNTRFGSVLITGNTGVSVSGDPVRIAGDLTILGLESQLANFESGLVEIGGRLVMPDGNGLSFTTTVLTGTDAIATPRISGTLTLRGSNTLTDSLLVEGILQVESGGSLVLNGQRVQVDSLFTSGSGTLTMANPADSLTVRGTAIFNGGRSVLTDGRLRLAGRVDGNGAAFQGAPTHTTEFYGAASQQVGFGSSGFGPEEAHFGSVELNKSGSAPFSSTPIYMNGQLVTVGPQQQWGGTGAPRSLNVRGTDISFLSLPNQTLVIADGAEITQLDSLRFTGFEAGATQLRIERSGGTVNLVSPMFDTTAVTPTYLSATDVLDDADSLIIQVIDPLPTLSGGLIQTLSGARIIGWSAFAALEWTGATSVAWTEPSNWLQGVVPGPADSVVVPVEVASNFPALNSPTTIRALNWQPVATLPLTADLTITESLSGGGDLPAIGCTNGGRVLFAPSDTLRALGWVDCPVHVVSGTARATGTFQVDSLIIEGSGTFFVENEYIDVGGDLRTADFGTLHINTTNNEGTVSVSGDATFASTPTPGRLANGLLWLYGDFTQSGSATAFQAGPSLRTEFIGTGVQTITFSNPEPIVGSYFGGLSVLQSGSDSVRLASSVYVEGTLASNSNSTQRIVSDGTLRSLLSRSGDVGQSGSLTFDNVTWQISESLIPLPSAISNVRFENISGQFTPQFSIFRAGGAITLSGFIFDTSAASPIYLQAGDAAPLDGNQFTVTMLSPLPTFYGEGVILDAAALLGWLSIP